MKLPVPSFLLCGDDLRFYCNDAFKKQVREAYPEFLPSLLPVIERVRSGEAGVRSEVSGWTWCFEGVVDEQGQVEAILVSCLKQPARQQLDSEERLTASNVTEQRRMERELELARDEVEDQRRIYEGITASTPDLMYVFDLNYKFVYANRALLAMWGRSWEDSIGQGLLALGYEPWHAAMHEREIDTVVATKQLIRGEVSFPHAVLGRRIYDYIFAPVMNEKGEVIAVAGTTRDISDLKAAEEALRKSEERLEQMVNERTSELQRSNEDLLQFAHVASHDLKEPTRKVRYFADRLLKDPGTVLSADGLIFVDKIISASNRMFSMIDGVLNYSKVTNLRETFTAVELSGLIGQIVTDLEVLIQQKEASIDARDLPVVHGAPLLLYQLFYNLINNSLKFARKGVPAVVSITAHVNADGRVIIEVRDNGIGFPQAYAEKIFSTFARLHPKDQYEGTGLGLSLCRKIVERHDGTISASSRIGEGSIFTILLPGATPFAGS